MADKLFDDLVLLAKMKYTDVPPTAQHVFTLVENWALVTRARWPDALQLLLTRFFQTPVYKNKSALTQAQWWVRLVAQLGADYTNPRKNPDALNLEPPHVLFAGILSELAIGTLADLYDPVDRDEWPEVDPKILRLFTTTPRPLPA